MKFVCQFLRRSFSPKKKTATKIESIDDEHKKKIHFSISRANFHCFGTERTQRQQQQRQTKKNCFYLFAIILMTMAESFGKILSGKSCCTLKRRENIDNNKKKMRFGDKSNLRNFNLLCREMKCFRFRLFLIYFPCSDKEFFLPCRVKFHRDRDSCN